MTKENTPSEEMKDVLENVRRNNDVEYRKQKLATSLENHDLFMSNVPPSDFIKMWIGAACDERLSEEALASLPKSKNPYRAIAMIDVIFPDEKSTETPEGVGEAKCESRIVILPDAPHLVPSVEDIRQNMKKVCAVLNSAIQTAQTFEADTGEAKDVSEDSDLDNLCAIVSFLRWHYDNITDEQASDLESPVAKLATHCYWLLLCIYKYKADANHDNMPDVICFQWNVFHSSKIVGVANAYHLSYSEALDAIELSDKFITSTDETRVGRTPKSTESTLLEDENAKTTLVDGNINVLPKSLMDPDSIRLMALLKEDEITNARKQIGNRMIYITVLSFTKCEQSGTGARGVAVPSMGIGRLAPYDAKMSIADKHQLVYNVAKEVSAVIHTELDADASDHLAMHNIQIFMGQVINWKNLTGSSEIPEHIKSLFSRCLEVVGKVTKGFDKDDNLFILARTGSFLATKERATVGGFAFAMSIHDAQSMVNAAKFMQEQTESAPNIVN